MTTKKTTDKTIKWRLSELPTAGEVAELVDSEVITVEEAREILFSDTSSNDEKVKALEEQIEFLQGLVKTLANKDPVVIRPFNYTYTTPNVYWANTKKFLGDNNFGVTTQTGTHLNGETMSVSSTTLPSSTLSGGISGTGFKPLS